MNVVQLMCCDVCVCVSSDHRCSGGDAEEGERAGRGPEEAGHDPTATVQVHAVGAPRGRPGAVSLIRDITHTHTPEDEEIIHHMQRVKSEPCIRMSILKITFMSIVMPALLFCCILKICHICKLILISIKFYNFFFFCCCFSTRQSNQISSRERL